MRMLKVTPLLATAFWVLPLLVCSAQTISHEIPAPVAGNQSFGGSLGMDFGVISPISVDQLGVFDSNADGLSLPLSARLYNQGSTFTSSPVATLNFATGTGASSGTLVGSQRFLSPAQSVILPAGFQGTIVADGYGGAEQNGNSGGAGAFDGTLLNTGGGAISFSATNRFGTAGLFPATVDGGPAGRYGAGTVVFSNATAASVGLQNATAIFSQTNFPVGATIDGNATPSVAGTGWANAGNDVNNTAVFETVADVTSPAGSSFQFTIVSGGFTNHTLGRFRISATEDDRATFANGLANGGDVTANWVPLDVLSIISGNPTTTFTTLGDGSILAGSGLTDVETYTFVADAPLTSITGFRIEMLEDPSLPASGPGRAANGNFVLLEFEALKIGELIAVPEPSALILAILGLILSSMFGWRRRRR